MKHFQFSLIRQYRESIGLTQPELAARMGEGSTKSQVCGFERGRGRGLTMRTLERLAKALEKDPNDFFT